MFSCANKRSLEEWTDSAVALWASYSAAAARYFDDPDTCTVAFLRVWLMYGSRR